MSYQGDDPNRRREQQRTGSSQRQPQSRQGRTGQPQQRQGQPQQSPGQQTQFTQGAGGTRRQPGGGQQPSGNRPGRQQPGVPQQGTQPSAGQQSAGYQQQGTQPPQTGTQVPPQGASQPGTAGQQGQFAQHASMVQSVPPASGGGMGAPPQPRGGQLSPANVAEIISTDVVTAKRNTPLATVAAQMNENDVGCVVVVDDDETPIGVLTDRKIALAVESEPEIGKRTAEELVSSDLLTGQIDMTVFEALDKLKEARVRRLPIVDDEGTLTGIVTLDDLLVLLGTTLGDATEIIAAQTSQNS